MLSGYEGVDVVISSEDAEIVLDFNTLTKRDVAANRGPGAMGASMAKKSQMRAYALNPNGTIIMAWSETETFDVTTALFLARMR